MDPITFDQLHVFLTIVEAGSFSAAARRLRRAQSAVSYAISNLERLLNLELFDRSTRTPTVTAVGRALIPDARAVVAHIRELESHARALSGGLEPRVALAVDGLFPVEPILESLSAFRDQFPLVQVGLFSEMLGGVVHHLAEDRCDFGISTPFLTEAEGYSWTYLTDVELIPVVAKDHPLASLDRPATHADLHRHTQLVITDRTPLTEGRDFGVISGATWRLADLQSKLACLRQGLGWGNMPRHTVASDLESGRLVMLAMEGQEPSFFAPMALVHRRGYQPGPAANWLLDRLKQSIAQHCPPRRPS
ncbi:MAG: LysR family transcriptional regulator [Myxococcales bacterium]|nr:LysR family transcriptional regulator [Myxococcales bacterium]